MIHIIILRVIYNVFSFSSSVNCHFVLIRVVGAAGVVIRREAGMHPGQVACPSQDLYVLNRKKHITTHHLHCIEDVPIAVDHDTHRDKETGKEEEDDEGGIIWVFRCPVHRAAQLVDLQRVAVPAQQRSPSPSQRIQPDVPNGSPRPGEVHHLCMDHSDVALVGQGCQSHDGNDAWQWRERDRGLTAGSGSVDTL